MRRGRAIFFLILLLLLSSAPAAPTHVPSRAVATSTGWTQYHKDGTRNGYDAAAVAYPASGNPTSSWRTNLDGNVYAEPLALNGIVYAATENNSIYALDEITGRAIWQWHQFASQPNSGCGNINPVGITGTPVIDPVASIIYAVGVVAASGGGTKYQLFAVNISNGTLVTGFPRDLGQANPPTQGERAALAIAPNGLMVYVPFGGKYGDCTPYHPLVVGVPVGANLGQPQLVYQPQTGAQDEAGIWGASGIAEDASGNLYVSTGNGAQGGSSPCTGLTWDHSEAVIKLSPALAELGTWAPTEWCALNSVDNDVGSLGPILLANGQVFQAGKPGDGYLLNGSSLTGINTQLYRAHIANCPTSDAVFGGMAYANGIVYLPCDNTGLIALSINTSNNTFSTAWQSSNVYTPSAPIVAGGVVWALGSGSMYGYDQTTGALRFTIPIGGHTRFATPTEDNGWVIVPETSAVSAFSFTWQSLGGVLASDPHASASSTTREDVFVRGSDAALWHRMWNGTSWQAWESLGGLLGSSPGAVSGSATRIDVFIRGVDGALWHRMWNGTSWQAWESLGGIITSGPDAAAPGATRIDVFARGTDNALWHRFWDGTTWQPWESLGGILTSDPGAVAWAAGRLDVFIRGSDNALWHRAWDGTNWLAWESLGGALTSDPAPASCSSGHLDVIVRGTDNGYWRKSFTGTWSSWTALGGPFTSGPGAVCLPTTTTLDLFGAGADYSLLKQTLTGA